MKYFLVKKHLGEIFLLVLIIFLAGALRIWQIDKNPPALFIDEVSNGYNAYSLLKTGKDEYGNFLPLTIRAFGDYNPALSAYLLIPSIAVFGLNELAVRLPSALLGTLTVAAVFFLALKVFQSRKAAFLSSFFLAISPWHLQFSRYDHEANFMLSFSVIGITLLLYSVKKKSLLILSALSFGLCLNSYHASKVWVPLIVLAIAIIYHKELLKNKKYLLISLVIIVISALPFMINIQNSLIRAQSVGIINSKESPLPLFLNGYLSHFAPNFLFIEGDLIGRHSVSGMGQLYVFELPLILLGIIQILKTKNKSQEMKFILAWLILAPIPAALATPTPHALRSLNLVPVFAMLSAFGLNSIIEFKIPSLFKKVAILALGFVAFYNIATYFHLYYKHEPTLKAADWRYGYKQMVEFVNQVKKDGQTVAITNYFGQPYIYVLFYTKFDPKLYQELGNKDKIGNIEFFGASWQKPNDQKAILVRPAWQIPNDPKINIMKKIYGPGQSDELFFVITEE